MNAAETNTGLDAGSVVEPNPLHLAGDPAHRTRLQIAAIVGIGTCVVCALWLIVVLVIEAERETAIARARSETFNLSAAFQAEVEGKIDAVSRSMDFIAGRMRVDPNFNAYTWAQDHETLMTVMQAVEIVSPTGILLSTSLDPNRAGLDLSGRDYVKVHLDGSRHGTYVGQLTVGQFSRLPGIAISRRIDAADGSLLGVIVVSLAPTQFTVLYRKTNLGPHDIFSLIGFDDVMRVRFGAGGETSDPGPGQHVWLPPNAMAYARSGEAFIRTAVVDHVTRLYSIRALDGYPLYVSVGFDLDRILRPIGVHAKSIQAIGGIATIMLIGLAALLIVEIRRGADREEKLASEHARAEAEVSKGLEVQAQLRSSEQRLRDYAVMASDWLWEQDADLRFIEVGTEATDDHARLIIGQRRWEVPANHQTEEIWAEHRRDLETRRPFRDFRYSIRRRDQAYAHVSINGMPVYDAAGRFAGYRGTGRDVTKEVLAEAELREAKNRAEQAEALLRDAVESVSEGFVIYDSEDRLVLCNDAYRRMYPITAPLMVKGVKYETLVRYNVTAGSYPAAAGREEEWIARFLEDHRTGKGDVETLLNDGRWVLVADRRMPSGGMAGLRINITALKQAKEALLASEARLERAQAIAGIGSWELELVTRRYVWSKELYRIRGVSPEEFEPNLDNVAAYVHPADLAGVRRWLADLAAGREKGTHEKRIIRPDGEVRLLRVEGQVVRDADGIVRQLAGTMQDITERRQMELQLSQAQKMEAIGNLTGGMAHDFNNGLGVIIGNLDLLARLIRANPTAAEICAEARQAAMRCAELIRGLLAFARRQPLHPRKTDVNVLVRDIARLLDRTLGEDIRVELTLEAALWPALADAAQLEAALVNLATNARDAMPTGGQLQIVTRNARLDAGYAMLHPEVTQGDYVLIEVLDSGTGIAPEIVGRIFEPFFTTKETGKGSGLGLAMVFGFVKQSGGNLDVYSEPGIGTTFRIYLPRAQASDAPAEVEGGAWTIVGGAETILLVEDNANLRKVTREQLSELGYRVLEAEDAAGAQCVLAAGERIDLLFTDVVMPGTMDGIALARLADKLRPRPGILLTSGFPGGRYHVQPDFPPEFRLLGKPYNIDELAHAVREVLDEHHNYQTFDGGNRPEAGPVREETV